MAVQLGVHIGFTGPMVASGDLLTVMTAKHDTPIDTIGRIISLHRKAARLSQIDLADLAGIGKTALFDIEHGKTTVRFETLARVLKALNITIRLESPLMPQLEQQLELARQDEQDEHPEADDAER